MSQRGDVMTQRLVRGRPLIVCLSAVLLLIGLAATAVRTIRKYQTPGPFDPARGGQVDFHNGVYFPARAFVDGVSPYGSEYAANYPVDRQIPFYSPVTLLLHAPLALLPLHVAEVTHFAISVGLIGAIALVSAAAAGMPRRPDVVLAIAAAVVFSRGGHITLFGGYFTFELALAAILSIHWAGRRPWLAALALTVATIKPTYILPLGFLLLARGNVRALLLGAALSIVAAGCSFLWLAVHEGDGDVAAGMTAIVAQISESQELHRSHEDESPVLSWTRIDLLAVIAKWSGVSPSQQTHLLAMFAILAIPMFALNRRRRLGSDDGVAGITGAIIVSAMLVSIYHQAYDTLVIVAPLAGAVICQLPSWRTLSVPGAVFRHPVDARSCLQLPVHPDDPRATCAGPRDCHDGHQRQRSEPDAADGSGLLPRAPVGPKY